jgi:hypothetical protein
VSGDFTSSLNFIALTLMVPELSALVLFTMGNMHVTDSGEGFFYTVSSRNLKLCMWVCLVISHVQFEFHRPDPYGSGVKCPCTVYYRTYACDRFGEGFFYTVSSRSVEFCMWVCLVALHNNVEVHRPDPYGSGVKCHCTVYYRTYACDRFGEAFFFTLFHLGT